MTEYLFEIYLFLDPFITRLFFKSSYLKVIHFFIRRIFETHILAHMHGQTNFGLKCLFCRLRIAENQGFYLKHPGPPVFEIFRSSFFPNLFY